MAWWNGINYVAQRDRYSCGPVAVLNVMKWAGIPVTKKNLRTLITACEAVPRTVNPDNPGTTQERLEQVFQRMLDSKATFTKIWDPSEMIIRDHIISGGIVGLHYNYFKSDWNAHFSLVIDILGRDWVMVNEKHVSVVKILGTEMRWMLRRNQREAMRRCGMRNCAWLFTKDPP